MSFLQTRPGSSPPTGISAGQWLKSRRNEKLNEDSQKSQKKYVFLDSSSDESLAASDFLKKKPQKNEDAAEVDQKKSDLKSARPKTSRGTPDRYEPASFQRPGSSGVLGRFADLERQIKSRPTNTVVMSSSDMDISSDSEIKRDISSLKSNKLTSKPSLEVQRSEDSVSTSFLPLEEPQDFSEPRKSVSSKKKMVTFASNLVQHRASESDVSLDHFLPESIHEVSLDEVLPESKFHTVMSLDDLVPALDANPDEGSRDVFNLQSVDELLPAVKEDHHEEDSISRSPPPSSIDTDSNIFNLHSIEEIVNEPPSPWKPNDAPATSSKKISSKTPQDEVRGSHEYSDDFHSDEDDTLKDTESISEDLSEGGNSEEISSSIAESISTRASAEDSHSYTQSFESETFTSSQSSASSFHRSKTPGVAEVGVQTDLPRVSSSAPPKIEFTESERTFYKPSQVLNDEALAVLSSYSPAVLAVQDMLKQQLSLTRDFIARSERLHKAAADALVPDYHYASLEEARQIINLQREKLKLPPKPALT